jgi:chemotaxis protein methyltransferase CheR
MGARDSLPVVTLPLRAPGEDTREYEFDAQDFERVRRLIYKRAGINLSEHKQNMVYSRLSRRLRVHGMQTFGEYLDRFETEPAFGAAEDQEFVNALTTNLTSFYREAHHFPVLEEYLRTLPSGTPPKVWCAAASTGEEPYTIAITMTEAAAGRPPGALLATDIDTNVLATAARAAYKLESAQACGEARLKRHFLRGKGANEGMVRLRPEITQMVRFAQLNLLDDDYPLVRNFGSQLDAVFCRNVMIYFDRKTQKEILGRIVQVLRPGGLLIVGHSENFTDCNESLALRGKTVYVRK